MSKSLSIVIPAFNEERYLVACLESIAAQTVRPQQVIVVDNNSTDRTVAIASSYSFVSLLHEPRQGIAFARNAGFDAVTADIIGRIDADTILPNDWVARVQSFYAQPSKQLSALTGGGYFYNIRLPYINGWIHGQLAYRLDRLIVGHNVLWGSNMALLASTWPKVRSVACTRNDIHEDFDISFHLHDAGVAITYRESLRVGASLGRIFTNRSALRRYMRKWPRTLRSHHFKFWWLGVIGNWFLWYVAQPAVYMTEFFARLFGRPPLLK